MNPLLNTFPPEVAEKLRFYVYRLIDPRNGETFYIGKGNGDRVFAHIQGNLESDSLSEKLSRIRDIKLAGFEVAHVIHRHGLNESTAYEVEAALIDAYPGITNIMDGHGNGDFGVMHCSEIIRKYSAETAEFHDRAMLINVNRSALERDLYEATRFAWRISLNKAKKTQIVLPIVQGLIVGAFVPKEWLSATSENFPGRESVDGRYGFIGSVADEQTQNLYIGKRVPEEFRKRGASNPIKYTW